MIFNSYFLLYLYYKNDKKNKKKPLANGILLLGNL